MGSWSNLVLGQIIVSNLTNVQKLISHINDSRPTRDHGEKSQKQLSSLPVMADWIFASEFSLKSKF